MQCFEELPLDEILLCPLCGTDLIPAMKFPCGHRICDDCYTGFVIDNCPTCIRHGPAVFDPSFNLLVRRFQRERKYQCTRCKAIQFKNQIVKHNCTEITASKPLSNIYDVIKEIAQAVQVYGKNIFQNISGYGRTTSWQLDEQGKLYTLVQLFDPIYKNRRVVLYENNMCGTAPTTETKPEIVFVYANPDPMNIGQLEADVAHPKSWEKTIQRNHVKRKKPNRHEIKRLKQNALNRLKVCGLYTSIRIEAPIRTTLDRMAFRVAQYLASLNGFSQVIFL